VFVTGKLQQVSLELKTTSRNGVRNCGLAKEGSGRNC